ncbi:DUF7344 domain-containing protein [Haloferax volcanii]|uniref:DUF7344 domain-containing protein n=1 Tax=Haloferax volcanii TaxID=2246 RepID=UPI003854B715
MHITSDHPYDNHAAPLMDMKERDRPTDLSEFYRALSASRRCYVILILSNSDKAKLSVRTLAREIAAIENGVPCEHATGEPYRNVYNALSQTHLPNLNNVNIVEYDHDRQVVRPASQLPVAAVILNIGPAIQQILDSPGAQIFDKNQ